MADNFTLTAPAEDAVNSKPAAVWIGRSIVGYGFFLLIVHLLNLILAGQLTIDIGALILIWSGVEVVRGNRTAAKWGAAIMALYAIVATLMVSFIAFGIQERVKFNHQTITPEQIPLALALLVPGGAWAFANVAVLVCHLRRTPR